MPELPEVELVARALRERVGGRQIMRAQVLRAGLVPHSSPAQFARRLRGARIETVGRRGKYVLLECDRALVVLVHLRMTGRFLLLPAGTALPKHTHAIFHLDDGRRLIFSDQRQFGVMNMTRAAELDQTRELRALAPEPLSDDFTPAYLAGALARTRRTLKETLLDQTKIAGLGNIYAAEALHLARANPFTVAARFAPRRITRLREAIRHVLAESIAHGSTLNVDPENIEGSYYGGAYNGHWRVYDREGEPCPVCRARIRRATQAGRSTFFCPRCQRR